MIYGYCRISKAKQAIERQIRNIKAVFPNAYIIQEVFTRTRMDRKEWLKLMKIIKPGDTIVFDSVSRMSGNAEEGFAEYERLYNMGVILIFLKEPHINTETYKKALETNIQLTGSSVDFILEGVNKYLMALAKEQIRLLPEYLLGLLNSPPETQKAAARMGDSLSYRVFCFASDCSAYLSSRG